MIINTVMTLVFAAALPDDDRYHCGGSCGGAADRCGEASLR